MKRSTRARGVRIGAAAAAVSAIGLAIALPASGHKVAYDTNLKIRFDTLNDTTEQYSGKVMSSKAKCEAGRTITLTQSGVLVGTTVSDSAGAWGPLTGPVPPKGAQLTLSTPRKILKKNKKHRHKCKAASMSGKFEGQGP